MCLSQSICKNKVKQKDQQNLEKQEFTIIKQTKYDNQIKIPHIIYQQYSTHQLPHEFRNKTKALIKQNQNWEYQLFNDNEIEETLKTNLTPDFFSLSNKLPLKSMKTDLWKYSLLYLKGGMQIDVGTAPTKPIQNWHIDIEKDNYEVIFVLDNLDQNLQFENKNDFYFWAILAIPGHPIFKSILISLHEEFQKIVKNNKDFNPFNKSNKAHNSRGQCAVTKGIYKFLNLEFNEIYEYANDSKNIYIALQDPKSKAYKIAKQQKIRFITKDFLLEGSEQDKNITFQHLDFSNYNISFRQQIEKNKKQNQLNTELENDHKKYNSWFQYFESLESVKPNIQQSSEKENIEAQQEVTTTLLQQNQQEKIQTDNNQQNLPQQNNSIQPPHLVKNSTFIKIQVNEISFNNFVQENKQGNNNVLGNDTETDINSILDNDNYTRKKENYQQLDSIYNNDSTVKENQSGSVQNYEISNIQFNATINNSDQKSTQEFQQKKTPFLSNSEKLNNQKKYIDILKQILLIIVLFFISFLLFFFIQSKIQQYKDYQQSIQQDQSSLDTSRQIQNQEPEFDIRTMADKMDQINEKDMLAIDKL